MINEDDVRRDLERKLGGALPEPAWAFLVERGWVADVRMADMPIDELVKETRVHLRAWGHPLHARTAAPRMLASNRPEKAAKTVPGRQEVIARLLATEAGRDEEVRSFREDVLRGSEVKPVGVEGWIKRQAQEDGPPRLWLTVPVPTGYKVRSFTTFATTEPPLTISEETPAILIQRRYLSYISLLGGMDEDPTREVPTAEGGVLERLRQLSEALARHYGWDEALATNFVLTGEVPLVPSVEIRGSYPSNFRTLARISLTVDPALSPREVADHYRRVRAEIVGGRHRELSEKHMRLATFTAARPASETLRQRMVAWNRKYPDWRYKTETNFGRDCKQAIQRLLHPDYGPQIKIEV